MVVLVIPAQQKQHLCLGRLCGQPGRFWRTLSPLRLGLWPHGHDEIGRRRFCGIRLRAIVGTGCCREVCSCAGRRRPRRRRASHFGAGSRRLQQAAQATPSMSIWKKVTMRIVARGGERGYFRGAARARPAGTEDPVDAWRAWQDSRADARRRASRGAWGRVGASGRVGLRPFRAAFGGRLSLAECARAGTHVRRARQGRRYR